MAAITTLVSAIAFGVGNPGAGAVGLAPAASIPFEPILAGVSCPTPSMCMIVGSSGDDVGRNIPLAARWNGKSWRWMARPPEPQPESTLDAVSCLSATRCIAIGNTDAFEFDGKGVAFGEEWDGATWRAMPPMAGVTFTDALGVSCATAASCMAVGGSDLRGELGNAIAEFWNGASWTKMTPIIPAGAVRIAFDSVACTAASHCLAVGSYRIKTAREFALAESWNGSTWARQTVPVGHAAYASVSCPRANLCLAVGTAGKRSGRPAAALWNGSTWHRLTTPKPRGFGENLSGVSCAGATRCLTVGTIGASAWKGGTSLTRLSTPSQAAGGLFVVSCARSSDCLAVGSPFGEFSGGGNVAIAWNGSKWRGIRENRSDALAAISCVTSSDCLAVGSYLNESDDTATLAQSWGGKAWRLVRPRGLLGDFLGTSCVSRSFCMATNANLSARWNGSRWKVISQAGNIEVGRTVSCASPRFCAAVGADFRIAVWNGTKWRHRNAAIPAGAVDGGLLGVSCTTPSRCVAVGWSAPSFRDEPETALVDVWNGKKWRRLNIPVPGQESILYGITCLRRAGCIAIGGYADTSNSDTGHNLAMISGRGKWRAMTMPGGDYRAELDGPTSISCSRANSCLAVGTYPTLTSSGGQVIAEVWNGSRWRLTTPAGPTSGLTSVSCTKPTLCLAVGQDGNLQLTERWNGHGWKTLTEANP